MYTHLSDRAVFEQQIRDTLKSLDKRLPLPANDREIIEAYSILQSMAEILKLPHRMEVDVSACDT